MNASFVSRTARWMPRRLFAWFNYNDRTCCRHYPLTVRYTQIPDSPPPVAANTTDHPGPRRRPPPPPPPPSWSRWRGWCRAPCQNARSVATVSRAWGGELRPPGRRVSSQNDSLKQQRPPLLQVKTAHTHCKFCEMSFLDLIYSTNQHINFTCIHNNCIVIYSSLFTEPVVT